MKISAVLLDFGGTLASGGLEWEPYHEAIRNSNVLFITLLAIPLFSSSLNKQKMMGIVSTVVGIVVLVI